MVGVPLGVLDEVHEQLVDLVDDLLDAGVGAVDLVDAQDDGQVGRQRLAQDEPGLRQRALARVDEEDDPVDHRQAALDLAAEVGVPGGVDDVDRHPVTQPGVDRRLPGIPDGGVLGEDGDPLLALEVTTVHGPLRDMVVLAEGAGLPEHLVHEGGLAVVDVRDDGDVTEVVAGLKGHEEDCLIGRAPLRKRAGHRAATAPARAEGAAGVG